VCSRHCELSSGANNAIIDNVSVLGDFPQVHQVTDNVSHRVCTRARLDASHACRRYSYLCTWRGQVAGNSQTGRRQGAGRAQPRTAAEIGATRERPFTRLLGITVLSHIRFDVAPIICYAIGTLYST
jgi:hypothetical protein